MEHGQPLRENDKVASLLKDVGQRLMIAEREVDAIPIRKTETPPSPGSSATAASASTAAGSGSGSAGAVRGYLARAPAQPSVVDLYARTWRCGPHGQLDVVGTTYPYPLSGSTTS